MNTFGFGFIIKPSGIDDNGTCVLNSLKKSLLYFELYMLVGFVLFVIISIIVLNVGDLLYSIDINYLFIVAPVIAYAFNMISMYFHLRKNRVEIDSSSIIVYVNKVQHNIRWQNVYNVSLINVDRSKSTRAGEYYKITYRDVVGYPFNDILAEKIPELEEDIARYYRKSNTEF